MDTGTTLDLRDHRFAITGASGFLGTHLIRRLRHYGAEIIALRRPGTAALPDADIRQVDIDFMDEEHCAATLHALQPTQIVHLAGYANTDRSVASIARSLSINLDATSNLVLGAMDRVPECRVVLAGSLEHSSPWRSTPLQLGSPYGMSKAMVEVFSGSLHLLFDANVVNMRIGMAYGEFDPNDRRIIPSVILSFLAGERPQIGNRRRLCDWIHAQDVADALIHASLLSPEGPASIDVGMGELLSIGSVAEMIRKQIGTDIEPEYAPELARKHEQARAADIMLTRAAMPGWQPRIKLRDGLQRTIDWYRKRQAAS